jgi:hypothetical protein
MGFIRNAFYKHANNVTGSVKACYQFWSVGPWTWTVHRDIWDAGWKLASPLIERKKTCVGTDVSQFIETDETRIHDTRSDVDFTVTGSVLIPITKVPYGPRETSISREQWLVVVTVVVWYPLRILYVLGRVWTRRVSFREGRGDTGTQKASPILSYSNGLCFGAHYKSSLWAQRNNHFTWSVASCGNGRCLMPVTNMCYQQRTSSRHLLWDMGTPGSPPTTLTVVLISRFSLPEDPPTYQWAQLT